MVTIFKAIRDNNVDQICEFVQAAATGISTRSNYTSNQDRPQQSFRQHQHKATAQPKQINLNKRSIRGRTALHLAATWNRTSITKLLLDFPGINVNVQDRENGWTALHRACYAGNLEIAIMLLQHPDIDLSIKDYEGIRPLELLTVSLGNMKPLERSIDGSSSSHSDDRQNEAADADDLHDGYSSGPIHTGGTDLYTWGSNTNYVLGHPDSESRTYPERVALKMESQQIPSIMRRPHVLIERIHMSKYHTAVLTSESRNNLLLCGFGRGGRLGNGKEEDTQLTPIPVQWQERIVAVALGRDHTVAVSENGNVVTFGSNESGQLGYETDEKYQPFPRKVQAPALKKQPVIGAAASSVHSVVYTAYEIFTFGHNQGQLGYHSSGDDDRRQVSPRKVAFSTRIKDVAANDHATVLLFESHEITLLCNFSQQRIILPVDRFPSGIQVYHSAAHYPVKLVTSGDDHLGAISNNGEVYVWTCRGANTRQMDKNRTKSKQAATATTPRRAWVLKKPYLAATDAALGHHGSLIVSTLCGQVFVGNAAKDGTYKFSIIPNLQRCIRISASPSGAFAGIRSEAKVAEIMTAPSTLVSDLFSSLPHAAATKRLDQDISRITDGHNEALQQLESNDDDLEPKMIGVKRREAQTLFDKRIRGAVDAAWQHVEQLASNDMTLDAAIVLPGGRRKLYCHQCILACRGRLFPRLFGAADDIRHPNLSIIRHGGRTEIWLAEDHDISALLLVFDYLYTDVYRHPMSAYYSCPSLARSGDNKTPAAVRKDLAALAALFELDELHESAMHSFSNVPCPTLATDLLKLLERRPSRPNVCLDLMDGKRVLCHEMIVRQRCDFFGALFEPGSVWMQARRERQTKQDPYLHVSMVHVSEEAAISLLRYLYGDLDEMQLFGDICKETAEAMMRSLVDMLCLADELLLVRLKTICECALARFVGLRTVSTLLEASELYTADSLKQACLQFITENADVMLATGMIDHLAAKSIHDIETHIRSCQADEMPLVRRSHMPKSGGDDYDPEFSDSLHAQALEDQPIITSYAETFVTIMPEPASSCTSRSDDDVDGGVFRMDEDQQQQLPSPPREQRSKKKQAQRERKGKRVAFEAKVHPPTDTAGGDGALSKSGWTISSASVDNTKTSLREIMEEQPNLSSTPPSSLGKSPPLYIPKKLSQKERRKLQQQQQQEMAVAVSSAPKQAWGKVVAPLTTPPPETLASFPSMSDLTSAPAGGGSVTEVPGPAAAGGASPSEGTSKGMKIYISKEELLRQTERPGSMNQNAHKGESTFDLTRSLGPFFSLTPIRRERGNGKTARRPSQQEASAGSFHAIQRQQELEDLWIKGKQSRKSLVRIQDEERAIEMLRQFYVQTLDAASGEWVDIDSLDV